MQAVKDGVLPALESTAKIVLTASTGTILARTHIISLSSAKTLSELSRWVLLPALLFTRVGETIAIHRLIEWWPVVVFPFFYNAFGLLLGLLFSVITRATPIQRRLYCACLGFHNTTSIALMMVVSIAWSASKDLLAAGLPKEARDSDSLVSLGSALIMLYTLVVALQRWLIAYHILDISKLSAEGCAERAIESQLSPEFVTETRPLLITEASENTGNARDHSNERRQASPFRRLLAWAAIIPPPVWAALFALLLGLSPLRPLFFDPKPDEESSSVSNPPFGFIIDALSTMGTASVTVIVVVLGVQISRGPQTTSKLSVPMIILVCFGNLVVRPTFGALVVTSGAKLGILGTENGGGHTMLFVLLLQSCTPTAINLAVICNIHNSLESEMATTLFYQYLVCVITTPICVACFLGLLAML